MGRIMTIWIALMLGLSLFIPHITFASKNDIKGHYFESDMRYLIQKDILGGYDDGSYKPDKYVTRAEFTAFLVRTLNLSKASETKTFKDVKNNWYVEPITIAASHNLIGGYEDGTFKPNKNISREEMAVMIMRALNFKGIQSQESQVTFADQKSILSMYLPSVKQLYFLGIISGKTNKGKVYFAPKESTTRGQTAAFLTRMIHVIENPKLVKKYTDYELNFNNMVDVQVTKTPKVDGAGKFLASKSLVEYYANPSNFTNDPSHSMQFLLLSESAGVNTKEINDKFLNGKGTLSGQGEAFIKGAKAHQLNEVYLIAHALHETGNGKSKLATGIDVGLNKENKPVMVTDANKDSLKDIKKTYNMFGIKAVDSNPNKQGSEHAYSEGWFTPEAAIVGGAKFIAEDYIHNGNKQNTLYKMRWNPGSWVWNANSSSWEPGPLSYKQYATHVSWAILQANKMRAMYDQLDTYVLKLDIPRFNSMPAAGKLPTGESQYAVDTRYAGQTGTVVSKSTPLNVRSYPSSPTIVHKLTDGTKVNILGDNGGWYKVKAGSKQGWVSGDYIELNNGVKAASVTEKSAEATQSDETTENDHEVHLDLGPLFGTVDTHHTPMKAEPDLSGEVIKVLATGTEVNIVDIAQEWYKVQLGEEEGWIHKDYVTVK